MIKTIIIDFAGVLTKERLFPVVAARLSKRYHVPQNVLAKQLQKHEVPYAIGKMTTREFWRKVCQDMQIPYAGFCRIFATAYVLNKGFMHIAKALRRDYQVILYSDNFSVMAPELKRKKAVKGLFDQMYFSNEIHLLKTDRRAFPLILRKLKRKSSECVFIDDKRANLVIPKQLGVYVIQFRSNAQVKKEMRKKGIRI